MNGERGFALIAVLWLVAALSALVGFEIAGARLGQLSSINRIALARARWAADACHAIVQARWHAQRLADTASVDLGENTRCHWHVDDPGACINVNTADPAVLARVLADSALAQQLLAARGSVPFASTLQLPAEHRALLTVDGPGTINLNSAPGTVLLALPGMTIEAVERIMSRRSIARPVASLDELAGLLSPPARAALLEGYADLARMVTFSPAQLVITAEGWVQGQNARATIEVVVVPLPERLAVVRRRMW
jgi:type II secretory pathway component PulK